MTLQRLVFGVLIALTLTTPASSLPDPWGVCTADGYVNPDKRISACNAALRAGMPPSKDDIVVAYTNRGIAFHEKREYARAIRDFDLALKYDPNYATAYLNRGNTYASLGDHHRAIEDYTQAIRCQPDFAEAYNNRGTEYVAIGELDRGIEDFKKALELKPDFAVARRNLAGALAKKNANAPMRP